MHLVLILILVTLFSFTSFSLTLLTPWRGDVWPSDGLRASLNARASNKELILIAESRLDPFLQAYMELQRFSLRHVMWITLSSEACDKVEDIMPDLYLGCGWSSQPLPLDKLASSPREQQVTSMYIHRSSYLARSVRLGYNVLQLDTDILLFKDPYLYLKGDRLIDVNFLIQRDGNGFANCGVIYIHGAKADGASAYIVSEVVDRTLRWIESREILVAMKERPPYFFQPSQVCLEQTIYSDALLSAIAGRPLFTSCWWPAGNSTREQMWRKAHQDVLNVTKALTWSPYLRQHRMSMPSELVQADWRVSQGDFGGEKDDDPLSGLLINNITIPNFQGVWPGQLGGGPPWGPRGEFSRAWRSRLIQDTPDIWPEQDEPIQGQGAQRNKHKEVAGFLPGWFVHTWSKGGWSGTWTRRLHKEDGRSASVMAHFVHTPGGAHTKIFVQQVFGAYNWSIAYKAKGKEGVYFAPSPSHVVGYHESVVRQKWRSEDHFGRAVRALVRIGLLTNRTVLFPPVRIDSSWLMGSEYRGQGSILNADLNRFICGLGGSGLGGSDKGGSDKGISCLWHKYLPLPCLTAESGSMLVNASEGRWQGGLTPTEFEDWSSREGLKSEDILHVPHLSSMANVPHGHLSSMSHADIGSIESLTYQDLAKVSELMGLWSKHKVVELRKVPLVARVGGKEIGAGAEEPLAFKATRRTMKILTKELHCYK